MYAIERQHLRLNQDDAARCDHAGEQLGVLAWLVLASVTAEPRRDIAPVDHRGMGECQRLARRQKALELVAAARQRAQRGAMPATLVDDIVIGARRHDLGLRRDERHLSLEATGQHDVVRVEPRNPIAARLGNSSV